MLPPPADFRRPPADTGLPGRQTHRPSGQVCQPRADTRRTPHPDTPDPAAGPPAPLRPVPTACGHVFHPRRRWVATGRGRWISRGRGGGRGGYRLYGKGPGNDAPILLGQFDGLTGSVTPEQATSGEDWLFSLTAFNDSGESPPSPEVAAALP